MVDNVSAAFASYSVFDTPFVHQMAASSMQSSDAVDVGPLVSRKVKRGKFDGRVWDIFRMSVKCHSLRHLSFSVTLVSVSMAASVQKGCEAK